MNHTLQRVLRTFLFAALVSSVCSSSPAPASRAAGHLFVASSDGLVRVLDLAGGVPTGVAAELALDDQLGFLAFHPELPIVYALGKARLHALGWDAPSASLVPLGSVELGVHGTHVAIDRTGGYAIVASYGGNAVVLIRLDSGVPEEVRATLGGGADETYARAHQVRVHPASGAVHVPCLGADHVATLTIQGAGLRPARDGGASTPPGAGPRHLDYHPTLPRAYVLNELASSITCLDVDAASGRLTAGETVSTLPGGVEEGSRSSDIHVAPSGRFLFAVNREPLNDIVSFAIDAEGGLTEVGRVATGGDHARTFAIAPDGTHAWVANTRSKELTSFRVEESGSLTRLPGAWAAGAPLNCVLAR